MLSLVLFGLGSARADAAFTSFYVFGDSLSTTATNNATDSATNYYYGKRYTNGRTWVEVLAQLQGLPFNPASNSNSYFGNTSTNVLTEINGYNPPDPANALVVVWVDDADLYFPALYGYSASAWTNAINQSQTNHYNIITNLYGKGIRNLVIPDVADLSTIPAFNTRGSSTNTIHQGCLNYNLAFADTLNRVRTNSNFTGLTIYSPDFFSMLTNMLKAPVSYGLTNVLLDLGLGAGPQPIDALHNLSDYSLTGPGTNYIFWDPTDPTALVHSVMAGIAQQLISPAQFSHIAKANGSNRLDVVNMPIGLNGFVLSATNLTQANWLTNTPGFSGTNAVQSVFVPSAGAQQFYRLQFPWQWSWP